jgi:muconolactone delta-isomerase
LFAADDADELERVLASMPLRIWRTDEVIPLSRHPNDPALEASPGATEFLTTFTLTIPEGTADQMAEGTKAREAERVYELAGQGHLLRLWALPGEGRSLGLWRAQDAAEMQAILKSLPLDAWMTVQTKRLTRHPSDPATAKT